MSANCGNCSCVVKLEGDLPAEALAILRERAYCFFAAGGVLSKLEWETMCETCVKTWREGHERLRLEQAIAIGQATACALARMDWPSILRQRAVSEPVVPSDFPPG